MRYHCLTALSLACASIAFASLAFASLAFAQDKAPASPAPTEWVAKSEYTATVPTLQKDGAQYYSYGPNTVAVSSTLAPSYTVAFTRTATLSALSPEEQPLVAAFASPTKALSTASLVPNSVESCSCRAECTKNGNCCAAEVCASSCTSEPPNRVRAMFYGDTGYARRSEVACVTGPVIYASCNAHGTGVSTGTSVNLLFLDRHYGNSAVCWTSGSVSVQIEALCATSWPGGVDRATYLASQPRLGDVIFANTSPAR